MTLILAPKSIKAAKNISPEIPAILASITKTLLCLPINTYHFKGVHP